MTKNLLSIAQIEKKNIKVEFSNGQVTFTGRGQQQPTGFGYKDQGLYWLKTKEHSIQANMVSTRNEDIYLWHQRLGHISPKAIKEAVQLNMIKNVNIKNFNMKTMCDGCEEGKMVQKPFKTNDNRQEYNNFGLLHWDICGPMENESIGGSHYLLLGVDDKSAIIQVYFLRNKHEAGKKIMTFINTAEKQYNAKVLAVRHDVAKEFATNELKEFYDQRGIQQQ